MDRTTASHTLPSRLPRRCRSSVVPRADGSATSLSLGAEPARHGLWTIWSLAD